MAERFDQLAQVLLNRTSLSDCSIEELEELSARYPYFSAAQYLLIKRQNISNTQNADALHKAALHAYQPLSLQNIFTLHEDQKGFENVSDFKQETKSFDVNPAPAQSEEKGFENVEEPIELSADVQMPIAPLVIPEPTSTALPEITFEPFHTVDYFASQGIKLSQKEIGNDNLGKQLKSFTEWLKTMKRIVANETPNAVDTKGESKVINLAAHSLQKSDVLTESMAEVWIKQGNMEKAAEVYNKLSLLNPSKKAYFASKIESLKKSN
jgi:hypothetical protein